MTSTDPFGKAFEQATVEDRASILTEQLRQAGLMICLSKSNVPTSDFATMEKSVSEKLRAVNARIQEIERDIRQARADETACLGMNHPPVLSTSRIPTPLIASGGRCGTQRYTSFQLSRATESIPSCSSVDRTYVKADERDSDSYSTSSRDEDVFLMESSPYGAQSHAVNELWMTASSNVTFLNTAMPFAAAIKDVLALELDAEAIQHTETMHHHTEKGTTFSRPLYPIIADSPVATEPGKSGMVTESEGAGMPKVLSNELFDGLSDLYRSAFHQILTIGPKDVNTAWDPTTYILHEQFEFKEPDTPVISPLDHRRKSSTDEAHRILLKRTRAAAQADPFFSPRIRRSTSVSSITSLFELDRQLTPEALALDTAPEQDYKSAIAALRTCFEDFFNGPSSGPGKSL